MRFDLLETVRETSNNPFSDSLKRLICTYMPRGVKWVDRTVCLGRGGRGRLLILFYMFMNSFDNFGRLKDISYSGILENNEDLYG